jgi:DNA-binding transcriptional MerR regulator
MNIAEFAKRCGLSPHTLRYYERIGLLGSVTRQANGHRTFGPRDVEWVEFLHRLRATGMGISEMLRYAELRAQGDSTLAQRQAMLVQHAERLAATLRTQQAHLRVVRQKIVIYEGLIADAAEASANEALT